MRDHATYASTFLTYLDNKEATKQETLLKSTLTFYSVFVPNLLHPHGPNKRIRTVARRRKCAHPRRK